MEIADSSESLGPFITVVSVDGGIQSGNKLTVITPTEIMNNDLCSNISDCCTQQQLQTSQRLSIVHEEIEESCGEDGHVNTDDEHSPLLTNTTTTANCNGNGNNSAGAYVTVLALGKKHESGQKKSVINIFSEDSSSSSTVESTPHVVAILSKAAAAAGASAVPTSNLTGTTQKLLQNQLQPNNNSNGSLSKRKTLSIVDIRSLHSDTNELDQNGSSTGKTSINNIFRSTTDTEQVIVYKLPGERLGFGLRFDGGVANSSEKVKKLFIQSCAENSPAARTKATWGSLVEGDEILEIENLPVSSMTRMDCIQLLKDASVVVHLLIRHFYSELELLEMERREERERNEINNGHTLPEYEENDDDQDEDEADEVDEDEEELNLCHDPKRNNNLNNGSGRILLNHHVHQDYHHHVTTRTKTLMTTPPTTTCEDLERNDEDRVSSSSSSSSQQDSLPVLTQPAQPVQPLELSSQPRLRHGDHHQTQSQLSDSHMMTLTIEEAQLENNSDIHIPNVEDDDDNDDDTNIASSGNLTITAAPKAPPRKGKAELGLIGLNNEVLSNVKIKPPIGFDDEKPIGILATDTIATTTTNSALTLPQEPKVYTNTFHTTDSDGSFDKNGFYSSQSFQHGHGESSLSMCESDGTGSTRSTVVSRLSMFSLSANNLVECSTAASASSTPLTSALLSKRIEVVGVGHGSSSLEGIEGVTCPASFITSRDDEDHAGGGEDEIPLAPPLHFQDFSNIHLQNSRHITHVQDVTKCTPVVLQGSLLQSEMEIESCSSDSSERAEMFHSPPHHHHHHHHGFIIPREYQSQPRQLISVTMQQKQHHHTSQSGADADEDEMNGLMGNFVLSIQQQAEQLHSPHTNHHQQTVYSNIHNMMSHGHGNGGSGSHNSHLIDINDDEELALLADELGLGQEEDEDEAEELRKFLLLEEKIRNIHDKDNRNDHDDDSDEEDTVDKQDDFGKASSSIQEQEHKQTLRLVTDSNSTNDDELGDSHRKEKKEFKRVDADVDICNGDNNRDDDDDNDEHVDTDDSNKQLSVLSDNEIETTPVDNHSQTQTIVSIISGDKAEHEERKCESETSRRSRDELNNNNNNNNNNNSNESFGSYKDLIERHNGKSGLNITTTTVSTSTTIIQSQSQSHISTTKTTKTTLPVKGKHDDDEDGGHLHKTQLDQQNEWNPNNPVIEPISDPETVEAVSMDRISSSSTNNSTATRPLKKTLKTKTKKMNSDEDSTKTVGDTQDDNEEDDEDQVTFHTTFKIHNSSETKTIEHPDQDQNQHPESGDNCNNHIYTADAIVAHTSEESDSPSAGLTVDADDFSTSNLDTNSSSNANSAFLALTRNGVKVTGDSKSDRVTVEQETNDSILTRQIITRRDDDEVAPTCTTSISSSPSPMRQISQNDDNDKRKSTSEIVSKDPTLQTSAPINNDHRVNNGCSNNNNRSNESIKMKTKSNLDEIDDESKEHVKISDSDSVSGLQQQQHHHQQLQHQQQQKQTQQDVEKNVEQKSIETVAIGAEHEEANVMTMTISTRVITQNQNKPTLHPPQTESSNNEECLSSTLTRRTVSERHVDSRGEGLNEEKLKLTQEKEGDSSKKPPLNDQLDKEDRDNPLKTPDLPFLEKDLALSDASQRYLLEEEDKVNNATFGESFYSTQESQRLGTTIQGSSNEANGMDSSHDLYHPFIPPTFSRLPPDGDEFPNSWSDENNGSISCDNSKKVYRSELKMMGVDRNPPPPVPISEPPSEEYETPPPLPLSVPPVPPQKALLARRSSSIEDKKRIFIAQNANNHNSSSKVPSPSVRPQEPSKKSVRDKIAMFSNRSSSTDESCPDVGGNGNSGYSTLPSGSSIRTMSTSTSSLPRSAASSAFSKSSDNLLQGVGVSLVSATPKPSTINSTPDKWKISQSTFDLSTRKNSIDSTTSPPPPRGMIKSSFNSHGTNSMTPTASKYSSSKLMNERSQSMLDVGGLGQDHQQQPPSSYQRMSSTYRYNNPASKSDVLNSTSMMESRRKANLSKLRGLVIPDKTLVTATSVSVVDLPTIISKDAVMTPSSKTLLSKPEQAHVRGEITRTESFDSYNDNNKSAKTKPGFDEPDLSDWKLPSALPKYSPAFKRRSLTPYQSVLSSSAATATTQKTSPVAFNNGPTSYKLTPEPKSLESLTSPHSDSSFEFTANSPLDESTNKSRTKAPISIVPPSPPVVAARKSLYAKNTANTETINKPPQPEVVTNQNPAPTSMDKNRNSTNTNNVNENNTNGTKYTNGKGKMEDSDNDSAVSSSRSSISHGLSPPNSPTPEESSSTPDPDSNQQNSRELEAEGDDSANSDEGWRVLKPQSVEAINRKNVLTSAKFSSGGGLLRKDDGSNNKNRRSDDDEADYADAEAEDTESSCSELDVSSERRRSSVTNRLSQIRRSSNSKIDTEEEEEIVSETIPSHSQQSSMDLGDLILPELTESPLQAIFDMEVQMAYINEICDALPARGESGSNRYFSRRESEATVIERPIVTERKNSHSHSQDQMDSVLLDRRARNRSSSGNESDFSSSMSVGSQNQSQNSMTGSTTTSTMMTTTSTVKSATIVAEQQQPNGDKWSMLEKKYSKSLTSVNILGGPGSKQSTVVDSHQVTSKYSSGNDGIEKSVDRMMEKSSILDGKGKGTGAPMPRGRNDFKSLSQKWQQLSNDGSSGAPPTNTNVLSKTPVDPPPPSASKPPVFEKPQSLSSSSYRSSRNVVETSEPQEMTYTRNTNSTPSPKSSRHTVPDQREVLSPTKTDDETVSGDGDGDVDGEGEADVDMDVDVESSWTDNSSSSNKKRTNERMLNSSAGNEMIVPMMSNTKRSVSVNDIRKAFEKAEIAVNSYGRDDNCTMKNGSKDGNGLSLPSAHFRVSSFDSTTSEESSATTPAGIYGSVNSLVSSAPRDPYGSITSLASSTSLISPQELQQLIDEANQSLEEAGTPSHEVCVIILHREYAGGSLGITLAGGADYETKEITVHKVLTGSIADRDGRIHRGDRVLSINGKSTKGLTHREALNLLKAPRLEVVLVVSRGRTGSNGFQTIEETSVTLDRAVEPLLNGSLASLLENDEDSSFKWGPIKTVMLIKDGAGLGFSLEGGKGSIHGDKPLTVKKIFVGGPAEKCGELKVGDLIVSINSVNMSSKSRTEAWNFMKKLGDGEVKINVRSPA